MTNNNWVMPVNLDASTVPTITKKYLKRASSLENIWKLDFSKCQRVDCAGLAMIIECIKYAQKNNIDLQLHNLDENVIALAKIHGIKEIITKYISNQ